MPYISKTIYAGDTIEKLKIFSGRYGVRTSPIKANTKETKKQAKEINKINSERNLRWEMNNNFKAGDIHCVLTYKKENRPKTRQLAHRDIRNFLIRLKRKNPNIKYIYTTVCGRTGKVPHHHIVISGVTAEELQKAWGNVGMARSTFLYKTNGVNDFAELAAYFIKQTEKDSTRPKNARRYTSSKNLKPPKIVRRIISAKKWRDNLKTPEGYCQIEKQEYDNDIINVTYNLWRFVKIIS